jgi:ribonuclease-3
MEDISRLEEILGIRFKDASLLQTALTHPSYKNENPVAEDNQRLEFLGDSVIGFAVAFILFEKCPDYDEGRLTRLKAEIVCRSTLSEVARKIDLGDFLRTGKGECRSGGIFRESVLSDALEAVLGSIYIDRGFRVMLRVVKTLFRDIINTAVKSDIYSDYKTRFQEICQKKMKTVPGYSVIAENGPDHEKIFVISLKINSEEISTGTGRSKKEAEQDAARKAMELFDKEK